MVNITSCIGTVASVEPRLEHSSSFLFQQRVYNPSSRIRVISNEYNNSRTSSRLGFIEIKCSGQISFELDGDGLVVEMIDIANWEGR